MKSAQRAAPAHASFCTSRTFLSHAVFLLCSTPRSENVTPQSSIREQLTLMSSLFDCMVSALSLQTQEYIPLGTKRPSGSTSCWPRVGARTGCARRVRCVTLVRAGVRGKQQFFSRHDSHASNAASDGAPAASRSTATVAQPPSSFDAGTRVAA